MAILIRVQTSPGEHRIAVAGDDGLLDYRIWRPDAPDELGAVHQGRVLAAVPAMAGYFVAIAGAEGFLPESGVPHPLSEGDSVTVRVIRAAQGGKGPRLACETAQQSGAVRCLVPGPTPLETLAAAHPEAPIVVESRALQVALTPAYRPRLIFAAPAWPSDIADAAAALETQEVVLAGGLVATIQPTRALVAIDIDTSAATAARAPKARAQREANRAAIPALARQIRLRNLAGVILIDFAGLSPRARLSLRPMLEAAFAEDPGRPRLVGFTGLGLAEIVRPRGAPPLHELLTDPRAAALAALRAATRHPPDRPLMIEATPEVAAALDASPIARAEAQAAGASFTLRVNSSVTPPGWRIA